MLVSIIRYVEGKPGRYVFDWRHLPSEEEDNAISMCALIRRWTDEEVMILIRHHDNLKKAAKILDRSYGAVRVKWSEIRKELGLKGKACVKCMAFPERDISLRMELMEPLLPRMKKVAELLLNNYIEILSDREERPSDREQALIGSVVVKFFGFVERFLTGKEHLEIYRDEKEHADQPEEG